MARPPLLFGSQLSQQLHPTTKQSTAQESEIIDLMDSSDDEEDLAVQAPVAVARPQESAETPTLAAPHVPATPAAPMPAPAPPAPVQTLAAPKPPTPKPLQSLQLNKLSRAPSPTASAAAAAAASSASSVPAVPRQTNGVLQAARGEVVGNGTTGAAPPTHTAAAMTSTSTAPAPVPTTAANPQVGKQNRQVINTKAKENGEGAAALLHRAGEASASSAVSPSPPASMPAAGAPQQDKQNGTSTRHERQTTSSSATSPLEHTVSASQPSDPVASAVTSPNSAAAAASASASPTGSKWYKWTRDLDHELVQLALTDMTRAEIGKVLNCTAQQVKYRLKKLREPGGTHDPLVEAMLEMLDDRSTHGKEQSQQLQTGDAGQGRPLGQSSSVDLASGAVLSPSGRAGQSEAASSSSSASSASQRTLPSQHIGDNNAGATSAKLSLPSSAPAPLDPTAVLPSASKGAQNGTERASDVTMRADSQQQQHQDRAKQTIQSAGGAERLDAVLSPAAVPALSGRAARDGATQSDANSTSQTGRDHQPRQHRLSTQHAEHASRPDGSPVPSTSVDTSASSTRSQLVPPPTSAGRSVVTDAAASQTAQSGATATVATQSRGPPAPAVRPTSAACLPSHQVLDAAAASVVPAPQVRPTAPATSRVTAPTVKSRSRAPSPPLTDPHVLPSAARQSAQSAQQPSSSTSVQSTATSAKSASSSNGISNAQPSQPFTTASANALPQQVPASHSSTAPRRGVYGVQPQSSASLSSTSHAAANGVFVPRPSAAELERSSVQQSADQLLPTTDLLSKLREPVKAEHARKVVELCHGVGPNNALESAAAYACIQLVALNPNKYKSTISRQQWFNAYIAKANVIAIRRLATQMQSHIAVPNATRPTTGWKLLTGWLQEAVARNDVVTMGLVINAIYRMTMWYELCRAILRADLKQLLRDLSGHPDLTLSHQAAATVSRLPPEPAALKRKFIDASEEAASSPKRSKVDAAESNDVDMTSSSAAAAPVVADLVDEIADINTSSLAQRMEIVQRILQGTAADVDRAGTAFAHENLVSLVKTLVMISDAASSQDALLLLQAIDRMFDGSAAFRERLRKHPILRTKIRDTPGNHANRRESADIHGTVQQLERRLPAASSQQTSPNKAPKQ